MPPIECPTSTSGPSGAAVSRTALRSRPSWSMVTGLPCVCASPRAERPWLRWSQWTVRTTPRSAARWKCQASWLRQKPCEKTTVTGAGALRPNSRRLRAPLTLADGSASSVS